LSYTLWVYEPYNTHELGDGWNGEDLSLFSYDDIPGDDDLRAENPADIKSLLFGTRAIESWCRPYPAEISGKIEHFSFNVETTKFELSIKVIAFDNSMLWQVVADANKGTTSKFQAGETSTLIYVPYVHYLQTVPGKTRETRLVGRADEDEWEKGQGGATVDIQISELSEGRLEIEGQWMRWYYPLQEKGDRVIHLKISRWK
jgi:hypothetical protein